MRSHIPRKRVGGGAGGVCIGQEGRGAPDPTHYQQRGAGRRDTHPCIPPPSLQAGRPPRSGERPHRSPPPPAGWAAVRVALVAGPPSPWGGLRRPDRLRADAHGSQPPPHCQEHAPPGASPRAQTPGTPAALGAAHHTWTHGLCRPSHSGLRLASGAPPVHRSEGVGNGEDTRAAGRCLRVPGVPQSSGTGERRWVGGRGGGDHVSGRGGRRVSGSRTHRPVHPGHAEPEVVLPEGLKAGPAGVSPWGAPCPPLQGAVQAAGTGGPIWEGSRGRAGSGSVPEAALSQAPPRPPGPPAWLRPLFSGWALPPWARHRREPGRQTAGDLSELACPTHSPGSALQREPALRTETDPHCPADQLPRQGCSASTSCLWSRGAPEGGAQEPPRTHLSPHSNSALLNPALPAHSPSEVPGLKPVTPPGPTSSSSPGQRSCWGWETGMEAASLTCFGYKTRGGCGGLHGPAGGRGGCSPNHRCQGQGALGTLAQFLRWGPDQCPIRTANRSHRSHPDTGGGVGRGVGQWSPLPQFPLWCRRRTGLATWLRG